MSLRGLSLGSVGRRWVFDGKGGGGGWERCQIFSLLGIATPTVIFMTHGQKVIDGLDVH